MHTHIVHRAVKFKRFAEFFGVIGADIDKLRTGKIVFVPDALHAGNIHHNKPVNAAVAKHTNRRVVVNAAVQIFRAVRTLVVKPRHTGGQHQIIDQKPVLDFVEKYLHRLHRRKLERDKSERNAGIAHLFFVYIFRNQIARGRNVHPAVAENFHKNLGQIGKAEQIFRIVQFGFDMNAACHFGIAPKLYGAVVIALGNQRAVNRADRYPGNRFKGNSEFAKRAPSADLVSAFCAAARQNQSIRFHSITSCCKVSAPARCIPAAGYAFARGCRKTAKAQ